MENMIISTSTHIRSSYKNTFSAGFGRVRNAKIVNLNIGVALVTGNRFPHIHLGLENNTNVCHDGDKNGQK